MATFLRKRILSSAIPLVCVVLGVFFLARMTGNPVDLYLPLSATPNSAREFSAAQGFDLPYRHSCGITSRRRRAPGLRHLAADRAVRHRDGAGRLPRHPPARRRHHAACDHRRGADRQLRPPTGPTPRWTGSLVLLSMTAASIPDFWFAIMGVLVFGVSPTLLPTSGIFGGP
ncbi:hypothetical protein LV779_36545 [Streptomyces thinghirensis]|nr:hypothetical protein [Streptomyces thinghirensis]